MIVHICEYLTEGVKLAQIWRSGKKTCVPVSEWAWPIALKASFMRQKHDSGVKCFTLFACTYAGLAMCSS